MKITNNSDSFPSMSDEKLFEELRELDGSLKLAEELGSGTEGVKDIIIAAEKELRNRGIDDASIASRQL